MRLIPFSLSGKSPKGLEKKADKLQYKLDKLNSKEKEIKSGLKSLFLEIISQTPEDEIEIHKSAVQITKFLWYKFDDPLDGIISNAKKLEIHGKISKEQTLSQWANLRKSLENYHPK